MTIEDAMKQRHSVRSYTDRPVEGEVKEQLEEFVQQCNEEGNLHIQLVLDEPKAFDSTLAHYGRFSGVRNYFVLVGPKDENLEERCGYYGEKLVLEAQRLGLNTCWVGLTYKKIPEVFAVEKDERFVMVIALGYGTMKGAAHKSKSIGELCTAPAGMPDWFRRGMEAVQLAPSALNQQKMHFYLEGSKVTAKAGFGLLTKIDLGIAKYHFEAAAGKEHFDWA